MSDTFSIIQTIYSTLSVPLFVSLVLGIFLPFWSSNTILSSNFSLRLNESLHTVFNQSQHSNQSYIHVGIWQTCYEYLGYYCFGDHEYQDTFNYEAGWMTTIRILLCIALLSALAPIVTLPVKKFGNVCCALIYIGTSILIIISISSYAAKYRQMSEDQTLGFTYILTVVVGSGYTCLGIMHCLRWSYHTPSACAFIWNHDDNQVFVSKWKSIGLLSITVTIFVVQQANFLIPFWRKTYLDDNDTVFEGIFLKCFFKEPITCCDLLDKDSDHSSADGFLYLKIAGVFSFIVGLLHLSLTFGCLLNKTPRRTAFWNAVISFLDGAIVIIVIVIHVVTVRTDQGAIRKFHASFFIAIALAVVHFCCAVISCIVRKNSSSNHQATEIFINSAYDQRFDDKEGQNGRQSEDSVSDMSSQEDYDTSEISRPLIRGSAPYIKVENRFYESIEPGEYEIVKIERIQNKKIEEQYKVEKKAMKSTKVKERYLWHGTTVDSVENINTKGFNRSYHGRNGTLYGLGTYFAVNSSYSADYSKADNNGYQRMYCCRVLTGDYTKGDGKMKEPPNPCHSVVDKESNPTIFVILMHKLIQSIL